MKQILLLVGLVLAFMAGAQSNVNPNGEALCKKVAEITKNNAQFSGIQSLTLNVSTDSIFFLACRMVNLGNQVTQVNYDFDYQGSGIGNAHVWNVTVNGHTEVLTVNFSSAVTVGFTTITSYVRNGISSFTATSSQNYGGSGVGFGGVTLLSPTGAGFGYLCNGGGYGNFTLIGNNPTNYDFEKTIVMTFRAKPAVVGIEDQVVDELKVYPNPTTGLISFGVTIDEVNVSDVNGRVLKTIFKINEINISEFTNGVYFLSLKKDGKVSNQKIVKI